MKLQLHPLQTVVLFHIGPVPITAAVVTTWVIMAILVLVSWLGMRQAQVRGGWLQSTVEVAVEAIADQIKAVLRADPWPYLPLLGTLFIYLVFANLSGVLPGVVAPTAHIETPAALALIVFFSVQFFGIRAARAQRLCQALSRAEPAALAAQPAVADHALVLHDGAAVRKHDEP